MKYEISDIHESLVNGNRQQMVNQIDEYGLYDFWSDYKEWLEHNAGFKQVFGFFTDATISYHRIKNR